MDGVGLGRMGLGWGGAESGRGSPEPYVALLCKPVMNGALQTPICAWKASRAAGEEAQPAADIRRHIPPPCRRPPRVVVLVVVGGATSSPVLVARQCGGSVTETGRPRVNLASPPAHEAVIQQRMCDNDFI